jgi:hypothetical protein
MRRQLLVAQQTSPHTKLRHHRRSEVQRVGRAATWNSRFQNGRGRQTPIHKQLHLAIHRIERHRHIGLRSHKETRRAAHLVHLCRRTHRATQRLRSRGRRRARNGTVPETLSRGTGRRCVSEVKELGACNSIHSSPKLHRQDFVTPQSAGGEMSGWS